MKITKENILEYILLDLDNELSEEQTLTLHKFLQKHPEANEIHLAYKKTQVALKQEPLEMPFPGKLNVLAIANQEKEVKVSTNKKGLFVRYSLAASILLLVGTFALMQLSDKQVDADLANNSVTPANGAVSGQLPSNANTSEVNVLDTAKANVVANNNYNVVAPTYNTSSNANKLQEAIIASKTKTLNAKNNTINRQKISDEPAYLVTNSDNEIVQEQPVSILSNSPIPLQAVASLQNKRIPTTLTFYKADLNLINNEASDQAIVQESGNKLLNLVNTIKEKLPQIKNQVKDFRTNGLEFEIEFASLVPKNKNN
jgi:hypothetical protein